MKKKRSHQILLGIFVFVGLIIFTLGVYFIGSKQNLFGNTTTIVSVFKNVNGLQPGNNVRFAGVDVGTVRNISILNDTSIYVDLLIQNRVMDFIKQNSLATISSDGLVGSMVVNIVPGSENSTAPSIPIKAGDTISSISQIATIDMLTTLNTTNENAALLTADLLQITNSLNRGEGILGKLIYDDQIATDLKESMANIKATTNSANTSIHRLNSILSEINLEEGVAGILLKDTATARQISQTISNLENSSQKVTDITSNLNRFTEHLKQGEGILNYAIQDTSIVNNLESTIRNIEEGSEKFNENMEALKHNFLFRGYFRRLERQQRRQQENN